jgi:hypothetical protein
LLLLDEALDSWLAELLERLLDRPLESLLLDSLATPPLASFLGFISRTLIFFFALAILVFLSWVSCLCDVSGTEQQLTPANDILLRDQVIQADQFFFFALWPLIG